MARRAAPSLASVPLAQKKVFDISPGNTVAIQKGEQIDMQVALDKIRNATGRNLFDGAFAFHSVM